MLYKKMMLFFLCCVILGLIVLVYFSHRYISGDNVLDYIRMETISDITVRKIVDYGTTIEECKTVSLNQIESDQFCNILSDATLKDIGIQSFPINTEIRYFVFFNSNGYTEGTMKFYDDDVLIFDYVYGDRPAIHKRYSIISSSFKDFFEMIR